MGAFVIKSILIRQGPHGQPSHLLDDGLLAGSRNEAVEAKVAEHVHA
jgi:hypothetical protein